MSRYSSTDVEREAERLRQEVEELRYTEQRRREQQQEDWRRERAQREEDRRQSMCEASSWEEAFRKGLPRIRAEAHDEARFNSELAQSGEGEKDTFFAEWQKEVERALELYDEEMATARRQMEQIRRGALERASARLNEEFPGSDTAKAMSIDDYSYLVNW